MMYANPAPNTPPPPLLKVVLLVSECLKCHLGLGMEPKLREVKEERAHSSAAELRFPGAAKMEAEPGLVEAEERGQERRKQAVASRSLLQSAWHRWHEQQGQLAPSHLSPSGGWCIWARDWSVLC